MPRHIKELATFYRQDEATYLADSLMERSGYRPCEEKFQQSRSTRLKSDTVVRLYTMDQEGGTDRGGISVGLSKADLARPTWEHYVTGQVNFALSQR